MKKNLGQLLPLLMVFLITNNYCIAQNLPALRHANFDDNWKFHLGNAADAAKDFNYSIGNIYSKTGNADATAIANNFNDGEWLSLIHI